MYRLPEYEYYRAHSVEEAVELLARLEGARVLAGGTDLVVDMKTGRLKPKCVVDIGGLQGLDHIQDSGEALHIGALTTIQRILDSPVVEAKAPLLKMAAKEFAYWQIRNIATIGGNLCNASPAADMAPPLLVYEAVLKVVSVHGERFIPIAEFFTGPKQTALAHNELLVEVIVPYKRLEKAGLAYAKVGRRRGHDMSIVAAAVALKLKDGYIDDVRIALNSVAPTPVRAYAAERTLIGKEVLLEAFEKASEMAERDISPITDVRAPAEYRLRISKLLVKELLVEASKKARRGGFE